jgi:hypothetical protein
MAGNKCSLALYDEPTAVNVACVCAIFGFVGELIPCLRRGRIKYFGGLEGSFVQAKVGGKRPSTSERFDLATHLRVSNYRSLGS